MIIVVIYPHKQRKVTDTDSKVQNTNLKNTEDPCLIERDRKGDEAAAAALYLRYAPLLHHAASRYRLPECDFEDIYQEASMGFCYALLHYAPERDAAFAAFAKTCVVNALKNYAAKQYTYKMRTYRERMSLEELSFDPANDKTNPEMLYLMKEQFDLIGAHIREKLSPLEREILVLYLGGHNYKFIASKLGLNPKAVDNALQRVRRKLKDLAMR